MSGLGRTTNKTPIDIITYPFSGGAALNRSFAAPGIVQDIAADLLEEHVAGWKSLPPLTQKPSARRHKNLKNYAAVKEAVSKLGIQIGQSQLAGHKTLVLGGDHSQGIATVKVSALVLVVKALLDGTIPIKRKSALDDLRTAADKGQIEKLGTVVSGFVQDGLITRKALNSFLDTIAVIWLDSHADYNDRHSSPSGNIHGMALSACAGLDVGGIEDLFGGDVFKLNPQNFYVLCARDIDLNERMMMKRDGVHYKTWELTRPGAMRTHDDPNNPKTLKSHLNALLKTLKGKRIIFSMDVDAIHAGLHKSPYSIESVAATGTPMGLRKRDVRSVFSRATTADDLVRLNTEQRSPAGPTAGDVFEAIDNIMAQENVVAADLSEISPAAGAEGYPVAEKERGLTIETSIRVLGAMVGADLKSLTKKLNRKIPELEKRVSEAVRAEKSS